jgi:hypothetical protein
MPARGAHGAWLAIAMFALPAGATMTKYQCVDANADGQALELDGRFAAARQRLETCSDSSCPVIVRDDCSRRLEELELLEPTVVFDVVDGTGARIVPVHVSVDGRPLADLLDGALLRVDPGEHAFAFTAKGFVPVTLRLMIERGEKGRRERIVLGPAPSAGPPEIAWNRKDIALGALVVGGALVVAGVVLGVVFVVERNDLDLARANNYGELPPVITNPCTATFMNATTMEGCGAAQRAQAVETPAIALFGAGAALAVAGIALLATDPKDTRPCACTAWIHDVRVLPGLGPHGAALGLSASF